MSIKKPLLTIFCLLLVSAVTGCKSSSWELWNAYASRFVDSQGRVSDPSGDQHTTSENESYAMFFALTANDRKHFDSILAWTEVNLAQGDLKMHLPARYWAKDMSGKWSVQDPNSASDADVWMAYTLIEAGRLWGAPRYSDIGRSMLTQIAHTEVAKLPGFGLMLLPGPVDFQRDNTWILNPSYVPVFLFDRLAQVDPTGPWSQIAKNVPRLLEQSARHGYAMDWVVYYPGDGFYPAPEQHPGTYPGKADGPGGGYDAIRVYLWAGMQPNNDGVREKLVSAIDAMGGYLGNHDAPPVRVNEQGIPSAQTGPVGFSAAILPYLRAFPGRSSLSAQQLIRMSLMKDDSSGLYGKNQTLYDQNLALFGTGFLDGRFEFGPSGELNVKWVGR